MVHKEYKLAAVCDRTVIGLIHLVKKSNLETRNY